MCLPSLCQHWASVQTAFVLRRGLTLLSPAISGFADRHDLSYRVIVSCGYPLENLGSIALASFFPDHSVLSDSYSRHVPQCPAMLGLLTEASGSNRVTGSILHVSGDMKVMPMDPWLLSTPPGKPEVVKGSTIPNT